MTNIAPHFGPAERGLFCLKGHPVAHNLYLDTLAFAGRRPWHQLGIQFDRGFSSSEAIAAARLDYPVLKEQLYRLRFDLGAGILEPTEAFATINGHTHVVLGVVGEGYEILQNREAFDFFDILQKSPGAGATTGRRNIGR